ncbi:hypothetical protein ABRP59_21055, partial [Pectobacterium punjabense]|uniref:hypothetical protein n=1 Tax=Pectobacterium punjabense TaxID=2108399 RepID=UPI0032EC7BB2
RRSPANPGFWHKLCRYAVPSVFMTANRAASDAFTRPINGARPSGQHKCCSKTPLTFLSDAALAFATSCRSLGGQAHRCIIFDAG